MFSFSIAISLDSLSFTFTVIFAVSPSFILTSSETTLVSIFSGDEFVSSSETIEFPLSTAITSDPSSANCASLTSLAQTDPILINRNIDIAINKI